MSAIGKVKASRVNNQSANTFVGQSGTIFYDAGNGLLRFSDGVTPGGQPIAVALPPGTVTVGNLEIVDTTITTFQPNVDLNLVTNGTGTVNLVGNVHVHPTSANVHIDQPIVRVSNDGQVRIIVPIPDANSGQVIITGNAQGLSNLPVNTGVMAQITGQANNQSRVYNDANGGYAGWVGRRFNGTISAPTQVLVNQEITRVVGNGYTSAGWQANGSASMRIVAAENHTGTGTGGRIEFWVCPVGTTGNNSVRSAYIDANSMVVSGNLIAGNVNANTVGTLTGNVVGTILTAAQPNITTLGILNGLTVDGIGLTVTGNIKYNAVNATGSGFNKSGGSVTANGQTGQVTTNADSLAKGTAGTFTINNNYISNDKDIVIVNIGSGGTVNAYSIAVTRVNAAGFCNVTITNSGSGALAESLVINFAVIKVN